jgi:hypothetical protein
MKRAAVLFAAASSIAIFACSSPPNEVPEVDPTGYVHTAVSDETLTTQGLLPPYPACCPGTECCQAPYFCAYFDTADASIGDAGASISPNTGLRLVGSSPTPGVGAACKGVNAPAMSSPVVLAPVLSYDTAMDYGQNVLAFWENDNDAWLVDGARRGLGDFVTDGTLSNGLLGVVARQPLWRSYGCGLCVFGACTNTCWDLRCDQGSYDTVGAGTYPLASQGGTMISKYPDPYWDDDFTDMGSGNPLVLGWRTAKQRLLNYWNTNKMATLAIVLTAADYAYGCSNSNGLLAAEAYAAAYEPGAGVPTIATDVIGFNMDSSMAGSFNAVRLNGWGAMYSAWPSDARTYMRNAMTFMRGQEKSMAFYVNPPSNGEAIDDTTFKFYLTADGVETLLPNAGAQSGCGSSASGYWLTRPEGPSGRIRINLCPGSVGVAAAAFTISGRVVYDCVEQFAPSASFVRTFDLSRCGSSDTPRTRALRFDFAVDHTADTYVNFRLRFAPRASDLTSAPQATAFSSVAWVPASWSTFVNLGDPAVVSLPANYQYARVEMDLVSSSDRRRSPTVKNWKLTFTCTDGN